MNVIDTHCHLYLDCFKNDIEAIIARAQGYGVSKFYLPAIDSTETANMLGLEARYPGICIAMMGLHPCSVQANWKEELAQVEEWLNKRDFVAIGEIGLDFYWDKTFTSEQYEAFRIQMQWALDRGLPIVIHTRNAMQETIDTVKPYAAKGLRGIFHCFSGDAAAARQIIEMGFSWVLAGWSPIKMPAWPKRWRISPWNIWYWKQMRPTSPPCHSAANAMKAAISSISLKTGHHQKLPARRRSRRHHGQCAKNIRWLTPKSYFCSPLGKIQRGVRVVEGARLESVYTATYRGFESLPLC
jgi:TatD family hydrolase